MSEMLNGLLRAKLVADNLMYAGDAFCPSGVLDLKCFFFVLQYIKHARTLAALQKCGIEYEVGVQKNRAVDILNPRESLNHDRPAQERPGASPSALIDASPCFLCGVPAPLWLAFPNGRKAR